MEIEIAAVPRCSSLITHENLNSSHWYQLSATPDCWNDDTAAILVTNLGPHKVEITFTLAPIVGHGSKAPLRMSGRTNSRMWWRVPSAIIGKYRQNDRPFEKGNPDRSPISIRKLSWLIFPLRQRFDVSWTPSSRLTDLISPSWSSSKWWLCENKQLGATKLPGRIRHLPTILDLSVAFWLLELRQKSRYSISGRLKRSQPRSRKISKIFMNFITFKMNLITISTKTFSHRNQKREIQAHCAASATDGQFVQ
jgi:hypothetical protein